MSLESGVILWRLNHELLPDPGNPIARMTLPLDTRGAAWGEFSQPPVGLAPLRHLQEQTLSKLRRTARPRLILNRLFPSRPDPGDVCGGALPGPPVFST